jgi:arylsulfatase A-like enzyme
MQLRWLFIIIHFICGGVLAACHAGATSTRAVHAESETRARSVSEPSHTELKQTSTPPTAADASWRSHYAFAPELARAELRRGETWLVDFGEPSDAKYSLGGWLTLSADAQAAGGPTALVVRSRNAKLFLPADATGPARITIRARTYANTALIVSVAGKKIGERKLAGRDFETLTFDVGAEVLRAGDNLFELRVAKTGSIRSGISGAFAIDWVAIGPQTRDVTPPPAARELVGSSDALRIPAGLTLGYTLEVPSGAALRATAKSAGPARLRVSAARDGAVSSELGVIELKGGDATQVIQLPLASLEHDVARIDLSASGGPIELQSAGIVVPDSVRTITRKPIRNVVLMLIDTLRADKLKPYNPNTRVRTPGLVRFLENAVTMHDARSQENWTKPSVATLLSSLYPWQHNAFDDDSKVPASVELLPEFFSARGYRTAGFIANGYVSDKFGFGQGWDDYRNYIRENRRSIAQEVAADVLHWLDTRPAKQPFFLYVHTIDPHVPYKPPKSFLAMYDSAPYSGPVDFTHSNDLLERVKLGKLSLNDRDKVRLEALYDGEISYHDVHFASILDGLDKRGLADDTLVVVTADHGEEFWDHGSVGHGHSVYDELLHVPLMFRIPGVTEGNAILRGNVGLVDVAPTILDALGLQVPDSMSGRSFLPELMGQGSRAPRASASGFMTGIRALAVGRLKLVQRGIEQVSLFDLEKDPGETKDIARTRPIALRYTRGLLGLQIADSTTPTATRRTRSHAREKTKIDRETEAQLRALGYVGTSRP